ncbi:MAG: hypothetical protein DSY42_07380 [Aquifex sp.]|nr:MAG: hypothetical protein DSY42_07380 [Aquifex sp.]
MPNYHPGRDISIGTSVKPEHIKEIHLIDSVTGDIKYILKNTAYKAPKAGTSFKTLAKPTMLSLIGLGLMAKGSGLLDAFRRGRKDAKNR